MADFQITSNTGRNWASGNVKQVSGQRALGFYRLLIMVSLSVDTHDAVLGERLTSFPADIAVGGLPLGRAEPRPHQLPILPAPHVQERQVQYEMDLDRARLEAIENVRAGQDLTINMTMFPTLMDSNNQPRQTTASTGYVAHQSVWLGVLDQMGYSKAMLIEVPIADAQQSPELAAAGRYLGQAQQALARGDYREAVGLCRDVLEEMKRALKDDDSMDVTGLRDFNKARRLQLLRGAARAFTHPARHSDDVTAQFEWNRLDAASTISLVAALLNELAAPGAR